MQVRVNNTMHEVPFDSSVIPLGKFVEYYDKYGRALDKTLNEIIERDYKKILDDDADENDIELQRFTDLESHFDNEACAWFTFWTGCNFIELANEPSIQPMLSQYRLLRHLIHDNSAENELPADVLWNGEQWNIQDFKLNPASEMSFNEIITSKAVMRQIYKLGKGRWDAMPFLCAIFFRKKNEIFTDELVMTGGERLKMLEELPLKYAIQVAFFLICSLNSWSSTLAFSEAEEEPINLK